MPTYEYRCADCGHGFETFQKFDDAPLTVCPQCGHELRKVFNSVGIVFKGSGFYSTDNHTSSKRPTPATDTTPAPATASTDPAGTTKPAPTPATTTPTPSTS